MDLRKAFAEAGKAARRPVNALPMALFSAETFYILFRMLVPRYMPGYGNAILIIFPETSELLPLLLITLIAGSFFLGAYPSLASGITVKESFKMSYRRYVHILLSLLAELLLLVCIAFFVIRASGSVLSVVSMSIPFAYFYSILVCFMALIASLFIYTLPSVVLGEKSFISAMIESVRLSAKNYPSSLALFAIPVLLLLLSFFLLILLPFSYTTDIVMVRVLMLIFVVAEAFVLSFALFLFSSAYAQIKRDS
jgi:hypothetical protein